MASLSPHPSQSSVIAVASGKGGVGKTFFSVTLAHIFAKRGLKTLLFDGDLGMANIDIQLGLMVQKDLGTVIAGKTTLNQVVVPFPEGGFDIIAGRSGSGSLASVPLPRLQLLRDDLLQLASTYQRTIIDLGAGIEKPVRLLASSAQTLLVVCTDEPTSLTDAYALIKVMTTMEERRPEIRIVVNASNSAREGERTYQTIAKACQEFLKFTPELAGMIRRDTRVRDAIRNQTPLLNRHPNTEAAEDITAIASKFV